MAKVYQAADGRWIVYNNGIKSDYFTLESEARDMATKLVLAGQAQTVATNFIQAAAQLAEIEATYFDRGYDGGGGNPITNDDIQSLNITAANLAALITLAQQIANFLDNTAVAPADYRATLNAIRTDL
jgi:hypothetical protein